MKVYVTGGAGYVGSHLVLELNRLNIETIVIDNLSKNPEQSFLFPNEFHDVDLSQPSSLKILNSIFSTATTEDILVHLAAKKSVSESVSKPQLYEMNNLGATRNLLTSMRESKIQRIIFASSAAVYGGSNEIVSEESECRPQSPYAKVKMLEENEIFQMVNGSSMKAIIFRFFNVIGAVNNRLIEREGENLIPVLTKCANSGQPFTIFGTDLNTLDGTCIRDYIHVSDIVSAIIISLKYSPEVNFEIFNLGRGIGVSVKEIVQLFTRIHPIQILSGPARPGDTASLITNPAKARTKLMWEAKKSILDCVNSSLGLSNPT